MNSHTYCFFMLHLIPYLSVPSSTLYQIVCSWMKSVIKTINFKSTFYGVKNLKFDLQIPHNAGDKLRHRWTKGSLDDFRNLICIRKKYNFLKIAWHFFQWSMHQRNNSNETIWFFSIIVLKLNTSALLNTKSSVEMKSF